MNAVVKTLEILKSAVHSASDSHHCLKALVTRLVVVKEQFAYAYAYASINKSVNLLTQLVIEVAREL